MEVRCVVRIAASQPAGAGRLLLALLIVLLTCRPPAAAGAPRRTLQGGVGRSGGGRGGRCLRAEPHRTPACDEAEAALWENRDGALTARLREETGTEPAPEAVLAAQIERRIRAGDLLTA